LATAP